jgi:hypothetical protein
MVVVIYALVGSFVRSFMRARTLIERAASAGYADNIREMIENLCLYFWATVDGIDGRF